MRRYGVWAGDPKGTPENPTRCVAEVYPASGSFVPHQCHRKRGHGDDGLYCYQHARGSKNIKPILNEKVLR